MYFPLDVDRCISHLMLIGVLERVKNGETVFLVTQYHQFCDLTAQSSHQAFCNFLSLLETHKRRHKWIRKCWRQSDNCYTYECKKICVATTQVFTITGIHCLGTNNTEPNHGGKQADTSGANMKRYILHTHNICTHNIRTHIVHTSTLHIQ